MKETFIVRTEWWAAISELTDTEQAEIFRLLFLYHLDKPKINLTNLTNLSVRLVWKLIEPNLQRNINQYDNRINTSKKNGLLGGRPKTKNNLTKPKKPLSVSVSVPVSDIVSVPVSDIVSVPVSDIVSVSVSDNVNVKELKKHLFKDSEFFDFEKFKTAIESNEKYLSFDCEFYYESMKNWSAEGNSKKNWLSTAMNWMLRDMKDGKAKLKDSFNEKLHPYAKLIEKFRRDELAASQRSK